MSRLKVFPTQTEASGSVQIPPSKYHLHRALILGSLADGETVVHGRSAAKHIRDTLNSLRDLGTPIRHTQSGYVVEGGPYVPRNGRVRVGSSGSTVQFLLGLGSRSTGGPVTYDGVDALRRRPIGPLLQALGRIGVRTESVRDRLPVTVFPGQPTGGEVAIEGVLSQWISGLLLVAPFAERDTTVRILDPFNERTYVHLTASFMRRFGIEVHADASERVWTVPAGQVYRPTEISLDADLSSAAFPLIYAALHPGTVELTGIRGAGDHPEGRLLEVLQQMEVPLTVDPLTERAIVKNTGRRPRGVEVDMKDIPDLIPALTALASLSRGRTVLHNIGPGRLKESNRVKAMLQLNRMGGRVQEVGDTLVIDGVETLTGADISSYNDHRVLMAFAIAASAARGETTLTFPRAYEISYPEFLEQMRTLGLNAVIDTGAKKAAAEKELVASGAR
ncbi:MAG: 3-phosphoshikimate 1-carboxyvinyltransferase [Alicyclobacillus sp.]|nr:3-phosphoshikimate 1-carboxyvinyltransferase [Alicyclobacillus sp.]